ncbi:MAG: putative lipopolysaccharide heptosyltransferase III [Betaproteobacteria bacterium]|nr:putative lipopolysaccharide heptosyltransferase III [Betaproteobacteria bacterium]
MPPDRIDLTQVARVLVIKLRHHGDVLLSSPVFAALKAQAPHLEIDALVYADTAPLLAHHPAIREVHRIDRAWKRAGLGIQAREEWRLYRALRAARYDLLIHLTEHPRGAWLSRLLRPRWAVARVQADRSRWWTGSFTHLYPLPRTTPRHTVEGHLDALRRLGVFPRAEDKRVVLVPGEAAQKRIEQELAGAGLQGRAFLHVHPGSRWLFKCWPMERFAALLQGLAASGWALVVTAAPDPREAALIETLRASVDEAAYFGLAGRLSLLELAALTQRARLFVGVDSAPMHIAAAMGTPTVALFGPSGEREWGPWQVPSRVLVSTQHPCRPCALDGCGGGKRSECLEAISVEQARAAVAALLAETA